MTWKINTDATNPAKGFIKANTANATTYTEIYTSVYDKNGQALVTLNEMEQVTAIYLYEAGQTQHLEPLRVDRSADLEGEPHRLGDPQVVYVETGPNPLTPAATPRSS